MHALKRNLIALALGAAFVSPAAFAQATPVTGAGKATADSVKTDVRPASPTLPTQADPRATDAISTRTTDRETPPVTDTTGDATDTAQGATSTSSGVSTVAGSPPGKGNWWKDADTDADGKISATEATANAGLNSRFSTIDADKDGFVTQDEYRTFYTSTASQGEQHAAGHSAVVTRDVWVRLDGDADSRISVAEAAADVDLTASFTAMDSNSDGFVTQAEYSAYAKTNR